ncbi:MAG TPA: chemotaxis protein [Candidatus Intestinimonas merdavium]|uniref:Stage 0 sporulation protein A homolog n=1 Tax=Candidatus Intestinimonas merdavium TaxID=2838622 RepID=A0A9D1Z4B6_9FIRM|nr:chemotaxis protein [Candidatus Intestinimonas merdavium]
MEKEKTGILLESGTNEMEIMEFTIEGNLYGINVAKVREIMMSAPVHAMPHSHPAVEGIFKPRDLVITVVDLPMYLARHEVPKGEKDLFIVTNFNKMYIAFRVHTVVGISRISWKDIQKPDNTVSGGPDGVATGIAQCGDDLVTILDFERIVAEIAPETTIQMSEVDALGKRSRSIQPIWVAEDSILLSRMIQEALNKAGYTNLRMFPNGAELWEAVQEWKGAEDQAEHVALIITDLEMPQMDGHRLTKLLKSTDELKDIPVIIFSSLITEEMYIKGKQLGADEQLSKPEIGHLIGVIDHLLARSGAGRGKRK